MTTADTATNAKMLERVRALLAKADSTDFPAEADSFRAKADEIMTAFAIAQWQVEAAQDGVGRRAEPVEREFDFSWWYGSEHRHDLLSMFGNVATHCRCVVGYRGHSVYKMPVIGLQSDLDYFDMLFTHLMLQMGKQLEPKPDPSKTWIENSFTLRRAGLNRYRVVELMYNADTGAGPLFPELRKGNEDHRTYNDLPANRVKNLRAKLRVAADKYAAANGFDPTSSVNPKVWQRSFANGFVQEVNYRLRVMREAQERPTDNGPSVALAIRDIRQVAVELYDKLYPPPPPPKPLTDAEKERIRKLPKGRMAAPLKTSALARRAGVEAGRKADLASNPSKGVGGGRGALRP